MGINFAGTNLHILMTTICLLFTVWVSQGNYVDRETYGYMMTIYVVPPITDDKILPDSPISNRYISEEISLAACPGEYEPASFVVRAADEDITSLIVEASDLVGSTDLIPKENVDIRVVKCWYQAGERIDEPFFDPNAKVLTPELMLKDDSLVNVKDGENYLKLTSGEYLWISDGTLVVSEDIGRSRTIEEIPVKDSSTLQSVNIPSGTNKQFWVTIKIPENAISSIYSGKLELITPQGRIGEVRLQIEVLPIELSPPYLTYSIYYTGDMCSRWEEGSISHLQKSEQQLRVEMIDLLNHGISNPTIYQPFTHEWELFANILSIRNELGINNQSLYYLGLYPWGYQSVDDVKAVIDFTRSYGISEVYFYGVDEANVDELILQREAWQAISEIGGKVFVSIVDDSAFDLVGDLVDLANFLGVPDAEEAQKWHSAGHQIFCYSNPQVGVEQPETYRRNFGLLLWQEDYDGAMNFAYQYGYGNIWNDFDHFAYRDHVFAYPTINGVIDTIQWEGWREGVDDVRYLTVLLKLIEEAKANGKNTASAEGWLTDLKQADLEKEGLDSVRSQFIDYIMLLDEPPELKPVGDRDVNLGELVSFIVYATDPDGDNLTYSVSNLPRGAIFDQSTHTFYWMPDAKGTYEDIHFQVSDGTLVDSENITIRVHSGMTIIWLITIVVFVCVVAILLIILFCRYRLFLR